MRKKRALVPFGRQATCQTAQPLPAPIGPSLVVGDHLPDGGMGFEQRRRDRRRDDIDRTVALSHRGEQGGREDDVAQEGGLNDERTSILGRGGHVSAGWIYELRRAIASARL